MKIFVLLAGLAFLAAGALWGEEASFQRNVITREAGELTAESAFLYQMETMGDSEIFTMNISAALEYAFNTRHSIQAQLPYVLSVLNGPEERNRVYQSLGDINLSYEYLKQINPISFSFGPLLTIPVPPVVNSERGEGEFTASGGRYSAGLAFSVTGIRDPVVWNAGLQYTVGLPKKEKLYTSWQPGNIRISLGLSDLVNDRYGFSLGLYQYINLPEIHNGLWEDKNPAFSAIGRLEVFALFEKDYIRWSVDAFLYPLNRPITMGLVYGHTFTLGKS